MTEGKLIYWHEVFAMGVLSSCDSRLPSQGIRSKTLLKERSGFQRYRGTHSKENLRAVANVTPKDRVHLLNSRHLEGRQPEELRFSTPGGGWSKTAPEQLILYIV
ncbi:hypothetical protein GRJ2_000240800 [Grus japonensis]|uniref:Uncharacterized protein n=1 Tax=Grus japonensis TaxID=30415 RepID=A0ABC9VWZ3_GRUJA